MTRIKICGIDDIETAELCTLLGVNFIGLHFIDSPWRVTPDFARVITRHIAQYPKRPVVVGLFSKTPSYEVNLLAEYCNLDWIQLLENEPLAYAKALKRPVVRLTHVSKDTTAEEIQQQVSGQFGSRSVCLLDSSDNKKGVVETHFDWNLLSGLSPFIPVLVGGGIAVNNVGELIEKFRPWGVNVNTGVEWQDQKSPSKIKAFIKAVNAADEKIMRPA
jgi:phosphoribosylanthranilate isomerase